PGGAAHYGRAVAEPPANHSPARGIGLEGVHLVTRDDEVELLEEPETLEDVHGDRPSVVGPHGGGEPAGARAADGLEGSRFERRRADRPLLVLERDTPQPVE